MMTTTNSDREVHLPSLHANQQRILTESEASRYRVVACGRRFGKTFLCHELAANPVIDGFPVGYFAPDYKRLAEYWESIKALLQPITLPNGKSETLHRIKCYGGGSLECWTLEDEDAGRSRKYKRVIIDEAGLVANLEERWSKAIRATLMDLRGDAWMLGTPKGRNFFWRCHQRGNDAAYPRWQSWQMPSHSNPYLSPAELREITEDLDEQSMRQEILAEFLEDGGAVFRNVSEVSTLQPAEYNPRHHYVAGIDWSAGGEDFTVVSIWDCVTQEQVCMERWSELSDLVNVQRVVDLYRKWQWTDALAENNSIGKPLISWMQEEGKMSEYTRDEDDEEDKPGIPVRRWHTDNESKRLIVERLAVGFERRSFRLLNNRVQIAEHEAFERQKTPGGLPKFGAPEGLHDDTVIANALAWELARNEQDALTDDEIVEELDPVTILQAYPSLEKFDRIRRRMGRVGR